MDAIKYWKEALALLEKSLSEVVFNSIICKLSPLSFENHTLVLEGDDFFTATVNARYLYEIIRCVRTVTEIDDIEVQLVSPKDRGLGETQNLELYTKSNLKRKYSFDTFVKGKSNELAYSAALAVSEAPGISNYNPLFLYGGVGLGKTHLLYSIGNFVVENSKLNVLYQTTEDLTNALNKAIRERSQPAFREKYRSYDLLLLDDIQFMEKSESMQEEMFNIFNALHSNEKQIVMTSDQPPKKLANIEKRLTDRFGMGLTIDVTQPDYETRKAILETKLTRERLPLPDTVKELILRNVVSNVRDLEGALNKITALSRLTNTPITLELARNALRDQLVKDEDNPLSIECIREIVAEYFGVSIEDLNGRRRTRNIVYPRQIAMYLCRKILPDASLPDIGKVFGGRDHATVIHSCDKIIGELDYDSKLRVQIKELEQIITG